MRRPRPQADFELAGIKVEVVEVVEVERLGRRHRPGGRSPARPREAGSECQQAGSEGDEQKATEQGGQASNEVAEALEHAYGEG